MTDHLPEIPPHREMTGYIVGMVVLVVLVVGALIIGRWLWLTLWGR